MDEVLEVIEFLKTFLEESVLLLGNFWGEFLIWFELRRIGPCAVGESNCAQSVRSDARCLSIEKASPFGP